SAKKLFGKQRLTRLVQVSFPAPDSRRGDAKRFSPFPFWPDRWRYPLVFAGHGAVSSSFTDASTVLCFK
ncbi:MAG TPA: hypothetical protein PLX65_11490, partial [Accumulibacter sp.]|nr:hypothetical protein [Accumulibacter sp.]HNI74125.1 hypothetical protein [Accumulibacter sp.]